MIQTISKIPVPKPHHIPLIVMGLLVIVFSVGLVLTLLQQRAYVASGNMYSSLLSSTASVGANVRVAVRIAPGSRVDTVTATVEYDTAALSYEKVEYAGSPFSTQIPAKIGNGTVTIQSAKLGGNTIDADSLIGTIVFMSKQNGTAQPKLVYGNAAYAGVATHPTVAGKQADETKNPFGTVQQAVSSSAPGTQQELDKGVPVILSPFKTFLQSVGTNSETAKNAAPWLAGIVLSILLTSAGVATWFLHKRYRKKTVQQESVS